MITNKDLSIDSKNGKITLNGDNYDLGSQSEIDTAVKGAYTVMGQNGAKNLIPCPYYRASGYSANGMTTTYDSDGVMTINKVADSSTAFFALTYTIDNYCLKPNTKYKLLAEFENTTQLSVFAKYGDIGLANISKKSTGKYAVNFTTPQTLEGRENIAVYATASDTETNAKVKVMIMLASDTDETYQPYAKTNRQLTEEIGDLSQTGITGADVAAQLGALNTAVGAVKDLSISTVSFADAGTQAGIDYGSHADLILTNISTLSTGIFSMDTPGPKIGVVLFKNTYSYFAGIILYYFASNTQKPLYFVYQNGTFGIKTL